MRINELKIRHYRSIEDEIDILFPKDSPVILFGPCNAGKTSILSAIQTVQSPNANDDQGGTINEDATISYTEDEIGKFFANREIKRLWQESKEAGCYAGVTDSTVISLSFEDKEGRVIEKEISFQYDSGKKKFLPKETIKALSIWAVPAEKKYFTAAFYEKDAESKLEEGSWQKDLFDYIRNGIEKSIDQVAGFQGLSLDTKQPHIAASNPFNLGDGEKTYFLRLNPLETAEKLSKLSKNIDSDAPHHLVLIDEPETHLHPNAEACLMDKIKDACKKGIQIIIATHSPSFLDPNLIEGFVHVYKDHEKTRIRQLSISDLIKQIPSISKKNRSQELINHLGFLLTDEELKGFFAEFILLVEGDSDRAALSIYFENQGFSLHQHGVDIIACGGKPKLNQYWEIFTAYNYDCYIIFDFDYKNTNEGNRDETLLSLIQYTGARPADSDDLNYYLGERGAFFKYNLDIYLHQYFEECLKDKYKEINDKVYRIYGDGDWSEEGKPKDSKERFERAWAMYVTQNKQIGIDKIPFVEDIIKVLIKLLGK